LTPIAKLVILLGVDTRSVLGTLFGKIVRHSILLAFVKRCEGNAVPGGGYLTVGLRLLICPLVALAIPFDTALQRPRMALEQKTFAS
jgi:hypothetical protein